MIDLRSDTVTKPTSEMLEYMFNAEVGDDVFEADPSINALEEKAAGLFGMEAALFCPSGTMTNQIGIKILSTPPGEMICDELSHVYQYEGGGIPFNSGLSVRLLHGDRGRINAEMVKAAINPDDVHKAETQLVSIENTCNKGGGSIYELTDIQSISEVCKAHNLNFHLDGARVFNALVESDYSEKDLGKNFDTISVCLSKGLGCPVGSLLIGSKTMMKKARRIRKIMGGGMRQAGYLAAAGIYALDHHIDRLKEDHERARQLGETLKELSYVTDVYPVATNVLVFELDRSIKVADYLNKLATKNILAVEFGPQLVRFVTHLNFNDDDLEQVLKAVESLNR